MEKVQAAKNEAETHRGWGGLHPLLNGGATVLSHLFALPAIAVAIQSKHGYLKTFLENMIPILVR